MQPCTDYKTISYEHIQRYEGFLREQEKAPATVSCFPVSKNETVETLKLKSMIHMLSCFEEILDTIAAGQPLPVSSETWKRKPFTRKQMLDLFYISPDCTNEDEITHRQRACAYPSCKGLYTEVGKTRFYCEIEDRKPIV